MATPSSFAKRKVSILLYEAHDLLKKDIFGLSDPYVKVTLWDSNRRRNSKKTSTIKKTLRPKWDEMLELDVRGTQFSIICDIYDENILSRDDFLGRTILHFDLLVQRLGVTNERYVSAAQVLNHGVESQVDLLDKWSFMNFNGYYTLSHVKEMKKLFERKQLGSEREHHESWGKLKVFYLIYEENAMNSVNQSPSLRSLPASQASITSSTVEEDSDSDSEVLPSGWDRRVDSNGRALFVNHAQRRTSLRRPQRLLPLPTIASPSTVEVVEEVIQPSVTEEELIQQRRFLQRNHSIDVMAEQGGVEEEEEGEGDDLPPHAEDESVLHSVGDDELGFSSALQGEGSNRVNQSQGGSTTASASAGAATSHPPQLLTALQRASQDLPPHWEANMTPTGRIYYINHSTQTTSWEKPRYVEKKPSVAVAAEPVEQSSELPPGWEARKNKDGRTYYVNHLRKITVWELPDTSETAKKDDLGPLPQHWEEKQMKDGRIFFVDHSTNSTQWEDPRLLAKNKPTAKIQYSRDYKQKYSNFSSKLTPRHQIPNKFDINVRRDHLFEDTYNVIMNVRDVELLKARLYVIFIGESGLDYGGVAREWFHLLSHEMFNPYFGLFEYSASDDYTLQINPESEIYNEHHLDYFKFIGRICGMAVYHNRLIDAFFIRPFYKMMLNKPITLADMQSVDVELWNSFTYILENDPEPLCLDFSVNKTIFDQVITVDLKPGGRDIPITENNKKEFINLLMKWRFTDRVQKQMDSFKKGFSDLVPLHLIRVFDEREIEYLLGGLATIDVEDWKANTEYKEYYESDNVIQWFWKAMENFDAEMRARFLQFVTGTSKVPMNGFSELQGSQGPRKFCIKKFGLPNSLPRAHTCFNRIDLPPYPSYHKLKEMLRIAVENTEGFEGVD